MGSKLKTTQMNRKAFYEEKLARRMALLAEKQVEPAKVEKDPVLKSLRANIQAVSGRLKAIENHEKRTLELAKIKEEKAAAAKAEKTPAPKEAPEGGKGKGKEKAPKAPAEGKEPKEAKEKKKKKEQPAEG